MSANASSQASDQPVREQVAESAQTHPFVGRENELRQLRVAFESAASGRGSLITLVGDPGVGKTSVCEQLALFVTGRGGLPLAGHCYEEGSFRIPYQPFVEAFNGYVHATEPDVVMAHLGSQAVDLARMLPMLREWLNITPRPAADAEEDRWRLLQAATDFVRSAAAKQPLLLVLEDLHDADRGTLDLLLYLARNLHARAGAKA